MKDSTLAIVILGLCCGCNSFRGLEEYHGIQIERQYLSRALKGEEDGNTDYLGSQAEACRRVARALQKTDPLEAMRFFKIGSEHPEGRGGEGQCCDELVHLANDDRLTQSEREDIVRFVDQLCEDGGHHLYANPGMSNKDMTFAIYSSLFDLHDEGGKLHNYAKARHYLEIQFALGIPDYAIDNRLSIAPRYNLRVDAAEARSRSSAVEAQARSDREDFRRQRAEDQRQERQAREESKRNQQQLLDTIARAADQTNEALRQQGQQTQATLLAARMEQQRLAQQAQERRQGQ